MHDALWIPGFSFLLQLSFLSNLYARFTLKWACKFQSYITLTLALASKAILSNIFRLWTGSLFRKKNKEEREGKGGEPVDKHLRPLYCPLVITCQSSVSKIIICQSILHVSNFWKQSEMERKSHFQFCKKWLISGKRIYTVPIFGVSRNNTLLIDSGQDSIVLAQAFEFLRFPLDQGESFLDFSCLTCAWQAVRLASSVSNFTSPYNERTWNAKGTDIIMTSPEREAPKTITKRSAALQSPTGMTPSGIYSNKSGR